MRPQLTVTKDFITIDTKTALTGEDILHVTGAHASDAQSGQDLTSKLLVNMADVSFGQPGLYSANIAIVDDTGSLEPLQQITVKITAARSAVQAQQPLRRESNSGQETNHATKHAQPAAAEKKAAPKKAPKKKKGWVKKVLYLAAALLAIYLIWTGISYYQTRQQVADQGNRIGELQRQNDSLGDELDTATSQINELRANYRTLKSSLKNYQKDEEGYRQQYVTQMQQVSQSLANLKQQLDNQTQQTGILYSVLNGRLDNLQTTVNQMVSAQSASQAQQILDNYKWYK
ncbi:hypothetical protein LFYK43_02160 [Ligilactobacillus salitolerans]|uniref:DUF5011 domain-containing protein n=1 Tax=Ligilactobacillus salitolerans TaxID=1808352 RepID=A0A401IQE0_9LACO|nr:hypothetical protein [Ligilactobacillus salitolerans]GBG93757.1 hypothetical protein LFYK43_02160 [Ligilactobacillus salitolerans]